MATDTDPLAAFLASSRACLLGRLDAAGIVVSANTALRLRLDPGEAPALAEALTPEAHARWCAAMAGLASDGPGATLELTFRRDLPAPFGFRCLAWRDASGLRLFGERLDPPADRLDRDRTLARLAREARTDALTGLPNRRQLDEWLRALDEPGEPGRPPIACIVADLDGFKAINDAFGHPVGDSVLREAARTLAANLRPPDWVARLGGEEFLILLPGAGPAGAVAAADRLRRALIECVVPPNGRGLGASFGVAGRRAGESAADMVRRADGALLAAKRKGRGRVELAP